MSLKQLVFRILMIIFSPWACFISLVILHSLGIDFKTAFYVAIFIAIAIVYKAIIPWNVDRANIGDVLDMWKNIGK